MKKSGTRKGRAPLKMGTGDLRKQAQEGNRCFYAWPAALYLNGLAILAAKQKLQWNTGTMADWLLPILIKAWQKHDDRLFRDLARTINLDRKCETDYVSADVRARNLFAYILEYPDRKELETRIFSISKIQDICGGSISERTAARLARAGGLRLAPRGRPKKSGT
jgi:hypothetical protein